ncbi:acetyltransferase [Oscillatoria amoena NRMC-F 0135]|nr:acetyltransferase [Oscillatoria amoena NRMC-F 0135]
MTDKYILQGGGEHARVVLDALLTSGADVAGIFDPKHEGELFGVKQLGAYNKNFEPDALAIVAIGNNEVRKRAVASTRHRFGIVIHPSVILSPFAETGTGTMLLHGAIIQAQTRIGQHVIINTGARVDHDCVIGDYVHIAPGAVLCGTVEVGEGSLIGAGSILLPGIKIGAWATVGAGSVVTRNVSARTIVAGNPARETNKS